MPQPGVGRFQSAMLVYALVASMALVPSTAIAASPGETHGVAAEVAELLTHASLDVLHEYGHKESPHDDEPLN